MYKQSIFPAYRGFNLDYLIVDRHDKRPDLAKKVSKNTVESIVNDIEMIADLGFNFVRLPMNYYNLSLNYADAKKGATPIIDESYLEVIDKAVLRARELGIYTELALHTAPGYSVLKVNTDPLPYSLWFDEKAQSDFACLWGEIAERYRGESSEMLGFNLVNEPPTDDGYVKGFTADIHKNAMMRAIDAIRKADCDRTIFADGLSWGRIPLYNMCDVPNLVQSTRAYDPMGLTHYPNGSAVNAVWPGVVARDICGSEDSRVAFDRKRLLDFFEEWAKMSVTENVGVHCGEGGFASSAPYDVLIKWFSDVMDILTEFGIGFGLWGFCDGVFGIMDTDRKGCEYVDYRGHHLDKKMYEIMKRGM